MFKTQSLVSKAHLASVFSLPHIHSRLAALSPNAYGCRWLNDTVETVTSSTSAGVNRPARCAAARFWPRKPQSLAFGGDLVRHFGGAVICPSVPAQSRIDPDQPWLPEGHWQSVASFGSRNYRCEIGPEQCCSGWCIPQYEEQAFQASCLRNLSRFATRAFRETEAKCEWILRWRPLPCWTDHRTTNQSGDDQARLPKAVIRLPGSGGAEPF